MIKSMTGFGKANFESEELSVNAEVKSLNSKFFDLNLRFNTHVFSDREIALRNMINKHLERGKISISINYLSKREEANQLQVNKALVASYYHTLKNTADALGANSQDIFRMVMQMPDALLKQADEDTLEADWKVVEAVVLQALEKCDNYRQSEGATLHQDFEGYIGNIREGLQTVESLDPERLARLRQRLQQQVQELSLKDGFDPNRFEQELIYYIEKLDINEEKVRLKSHLDYFLKTLDGPQSNGKKLNFICQEIGREINTIGSKANHSGMQQTVVGMKEELEKIKEQILNIL